ncbi:MAG: MFS transporter [Pirellulales bacterium]|nr:MFS transporter [Pirellulales bacterium]
MTSDSGPSPPPASTEAQAPGVHHPVGFWFFFWGEFAERCSYYGMKTLLPLYLTNEMNISDGLAGAVQSWFKMAVYFLPLVGGYIADKFFGKYWTIIGFSIPYVLGHFILGIPQEWAVFTALALLAGGSGVIKPNVSTLMGLTYDQQRAGQDQLRAAAFMWFYFAVNIGSFISTSALPFARDKWGYAAAFQVPAWLMVAALAVFAAGKPFYAVEKIEHRLATPTERSEQRATLKSLFAIFLFIVFFWIAYEQNDSLWIYFLRDHVTLPQLWFMDKPLKSDALQAINPFLVVVFVPLFNFAFARLDPQAKFITRTRKMFAGLLFTGAASALMAAAGYLSEISGGNVSIGWYVAAFSVLTIGEVLVYGTGLELVYTFAPPRMKSFVTACFLLTVAIANFVNSGLFQFYGGRKAENTEEWRLPTVSPGTFFALTAAMMAAAAVGFYFVGRRFERGIVAKSNAGK